MNWDQLLCEERQRTHSISNTSDTRNEFQKDYHRIICSASFRRLQDKTQVFPLDNSDFVRTRLTHSLEVSSFAKSLGQTAFQYLINNKRYNDINFAIKEKCCSILECAGLLHDIGNPPFGHFGEESIRNWFKENIGEFEYNKTKIDKYLDEQMINDLFNFEGNAQALRLLTKLHFLVDQNGMNLTYALLNTLIKYPVSSIEIDKDSEDIKYHKMGYYFAEKDLFEKITKSTGAVGCRYPLTFLLEAADDIAYKTADIEDAVKKGIISYDLLLSELKNNKYVDKCSSKDEVTHYNNIHSLGELESKIEKLTAEYESARQEVNKLSEKLSQFKAVEKQVGRYFDLLEKSELSESEKLQLKMYGSLVERCSIHSRDELRRVEKLRKDTSEKVECLNEQIKKCKQMYDTYADIADTYKKISEGDYISNLIAEKKREDEQKKNVIHKKLR